MRGICKFSPSVQARSLLPDRSLSHASWRRSRGGFADPGEYEGKTVDL